MHCQNESLSVGSITYFLDTASRLTALSQGEISTNDRASACPRKKSFLRVHNSPMEGVGSPFTYILRKIFSYVTSNVKNIRRRIRFNKTFSCLILQVRKRAQKMHPAPFDVFLRNFVL